MRIICRPMKRVSKLGRSRFTRNTRIQQDNTAENEIESLSNCTLKLLRTHYELFGSLGRHIWGTLSIVASAAELGMLHDFVTIFRWTIFRLGTTRLQMIRISPSMTFPGGIRYLLNLRYPIPYHKSGLVSYKLLQT